MSALRPVFPIKNGQREDTIRLFLNSPAASCHAVSGMEKQQRSCVTCSWLRFTVERVAVADWCYGMDADRT